MDESAKELQKKTLGFETKQNFNLDSLQWMDAVCLIHCDWKTTRNTQCINLCHRQIPHHNWSGQMQSGEKDAGKSAIKLHGRVLEEAPTYK